MPGTNGSETNSRTVQISTAVRLLVQRRAGGRGKRSPPVAVRRAASSVSGRNFLYRVKSGDQTLFVKVRANPDDRAEAERWALGLVPRELAPRLMWSAASLELPGMISSRGAPSAGVPAAQVGRVLALGLLPGRRPAPPFSDDLIDRAAALFAALHRLRPRSGPRLRVPDDPSTLLEWSRRLLAQVRRRALLDPDTLRLVGRAARRLGGEVKRGRPGGEAHTFCHGDLRWHNLLLHRGTLKAVDFEDAGVGDPALDLAMMACRAPLAAAEELRLLDRYMLHGRRDIDFVRRYFLLKRTFGLAIALGSLLDLDLCWQRRLHVAGSPRSFASQRRPRVEHELQLALRRVLSPPIEVARPRVAVAR